MVFYLDADYSRRVRPGQDTLAELLFFYCRRDGIQFEVKELNPGGWGDVMWTGLDGVYSGEIKGAGEILGKLDHAWSQLQRQMEHCDRAFLSIYGLAEQAEDGNTYSLIRRGDDREIWSRGDDAEFSRTYRRRYHRQNYKGYRRWLARRDQVGISIFESASLEELAIQLVSQYVVATTESDSLNRLIVEKFRLSETDAGKRRFMMQVMGLQAGWGEELAEALSTRYANIADLLRDFEDETERGFDTGIALLPLRSGKRTIGPAAVERLRKALGA